MDFLVAGACSVQLALVVDRIWLPGLWIHGTELRQDLTA